MGTRVKFVPLYGARDGQRALSYLLEIDELTILLDCGWTEEYDLALLRPLIQMLPKLKYQQFVRLSGKGAGFTLTAMAAGHTLGGAIWRITTPVEEQVVYAPASNHQRESHLNAGVLEKVASRPAVLICGCHGSVNHSRGPPATRKDREKGLIDAVKRTLRSGGNVLIPVDAVGRLLELVLLLDGHWAAGALTYPLGLLTHAGGSTLEAARSQLEWMSHALSKDFGTKRDNPFACRRVRVLHQASEALALSGPRVILATSQTLMQGAARVLFAEWASDPRNLILFPYAPQEGSFAATVVSAAMQPHAPSSASLPMTLSHRQELQGAELEAWQQAQHDRLMQGDQESDEEEDDISEALVRKFSEPAALLSKRSSGLAEALQSRTSGISIARMSRSLLSSASQSFASPEDAGNAELAHVAVASDPAINPDVLLDGFKCPEGCVAPMFPDEDLSEDEREWDDFGCTLGPNEFVKSSAFAPEGAFMTSGGALTDPQGGNQGDEDLGQEEDQGEPPPSKIVTLQKSVQLRAKVMVLEFAGLSDIQSTAVILGNVAPRHLILINGSEQATEALKAAFTAQSSSGNAKIHAPAVAESVDASTGSSAYHVVLAESLLNQLRMRPMGDCQVAWLNGVASSTAEEEGQPPELVPGEPTIHDEAFIVDERLSEVAGALAKAGIAAEWASSALVMCGGRVIVKRGGSPDSNDLVVQGALCGDFYRVQAVIRSQYHIC
ncbi:hypothetical protein WJX73_004218 [Symbiochloris irregularis]|uniref:Cleavage and polyadenylation specificity factor subunit 2 n=1 Tax=Symbiochloris irregularis TaxID=706552 RepID=A0AAW1NUG2_9CHLO